jgi:hypothetical protein
VKYILHSGVYSWSDSKGQTTEYGVRREVFDAEPTTLGQLSCHVTTLNPGEWAPDSPRRPEEAILVVKEGTLVIAQRTGPQGGVVTQAGPGAVIFHASGDWQGLSNHGLAPVTYYVFNFVPYGLSTNRLH